MGIVFSGEILGEYIQQVIGNKDLVVMRDVSFQDIFLGKMEPA